MKQARKRRTHISLPENLIREIDALVGSRGRSAFLVETAREAVRRRKLLHFLEGEAPAWNESDHPELTGGSGAWIHRLRQENEKRIGKVPGRTKPRRSK
jgi:Arc/MetJ-type ribon-helix-helix transcriptional regulator